MTSLHVRLEDNIQTNSKLAAMENDKLDNLQSELVKLAKFSEQEQYEYDLINGVCTIILHLCIVHICGIFSSYIELFTHPDTMPTLYYRNGNVYYMKRRKLIKN